MARVFRPKGPGQHTFFAASLVAPKKVSSMSTHEAKALDASSRYEYLRSDGTGYIILGSAVAGIAAYAYQLLGGRVLGAEDFAPVSVLLTIHFLTLVVFLLPIEQMVIRRLTLDADSTALTPSAYWLGGLTLLGAIVFAWFGVDSYLNGDRRFVVFAGLTIAGHFLFVVARGHLAGRRWFREYGMASGGASLLRLGVAVVITLVHPSASGFAVGLVLGPVVVMLWRPFRARRGDSIELDEVDVGRNQTGSRLAGLVLASAASQALLLSGPIGVGLLGGSAVEISVAFAAFTLARAPLVFGYNLLARVLPPFTDMAARGENKELQSWARGLAWAGVGLAGVAAPLGWLLGPSVVRLAFGSSFSLGNVEAALISAGVALAGVGLFIGQILVACGRTARLSIAWLVGLVSASAVALFGPVHGPVGRVATAFVIGEVLALFFLVSGVSEVASIGYRRLSPLSLLARRTVDIAVAVFVLTLTAPIILVACAAVRLESPGPIFYRQTRIGKDGRPFGLVKIRSMRMDGEEEVFAAHIAQLEEALNTHGAGSLRIVDDSRITRVGRYLRRWSIDELPNFWNVLRGSMSLVGPRPLVAEEARLIGLDHSRFTVKPGITGLAQVMGRDSITLSERTAFDEEYVARTSPWFDLVVILRTLRALVAHPGT